MDTFKCNVCKNIFIQEWTIEEAEKEYREKFGDIPKDEELVCDDCYKKIIVVNEN